MSPARSSQVSAGTTQEESPTSALDPHKRLLLERRFRGVGEVPSEPIPQTSCGVNIRDYCSNIALLTDDSHAPTMSGEHRTDRSTARPSSVSPPPARTDSNPSERPPSGSAPPDKLSNCTSAEGSNNVINNFGDIVGSTFAIVNLGGNSNSVGVASVGLASAGAVSHASTGASNQTMITAHLKPKKNSNSQPCPVVAENEAPAAPSISKKKSIPLKRPASAIGKPNRQQPQWNTPEKTKKNTAPPCDDHTHPNKRQRLDMITEEDAKPTTNSAIQANHVSDSGDGDTPDVAMAPSDSRDRSSSSHPGKGNRYSTPAKSTVANPRLSNQKTLDGFFTSATKKNGNGADPKGIDGIKINLNPCDGNASMSIEETVTPARQKKSGPSRTPPKHFYDTPLSDVQGHTSSHSTHDPFAAEELERLRHENRDLLKRLDDVGAQLKAVSNNQTIFNSQLQTALKHRTAELDRFRKESNQRMSRAMNVVERLIREEHSREAKELRQRLATDGARLGRLVSSRVGPGSIMHSHSSIETWEDGHAPRMLKKRRADLRKKREALEKKRDALEKAWEIGSGEASLTKRSPPEMPQSVDFYVESSMSSSRFSNKTEAAIPKHFDFDRFEAEETVRKHLKEVMKNESDLEEEERALNLEKRAHVRALKIVASEDSSKFRLRHKLHDRYILLNLMGKGGFSEVWRAYDLAEMRHVAVKIHQLEPSWSDAKKENYTKHVSREYEIQRDVRHPRIVSLYDVFEIDTDSFATVLECCNGSDLDTILKERGRLSERDARAVLLQILSGMRYLSAPSADGQRQGIIHYDLKPGNILFDEHGNAKITDFGLSKIVDNADPGDSMELTSQGAGTYWYLPPECFVMDQNVRISNKVDVWSIGVIYFQMLYGRRPFGDGESQDRVLRNQTMLHATEVIFPPKPTISEVGKDFIRTCLTYDQVHRPNMSQICGHQYLQLRTL